MSSPKTVIIAEAGVNHNGDMSLAYQMIDVAAQAGVDVVKFQTFFSEALVTPQARQADYQIHNTKKTESQYEMLKRLELSHHNHFLLKDYCIQKGVKFFSTGFDIHSLQFLSQLDFDYYKIPSGELTNLPYLRFLAALGKPVFLSTGMADLQEVADSIKALELAGLKRSKITVLQCNTEYPTPMEDVNLRAMRTLRDVLNVEVGYSDHTLGIEVPIAAVALGATIIEKHFTLSRDLPGPDHCASIEPAELCQMVKAIRNIEVALGNSEKVVSKSEVKNKLVARKSIVAARDIEIGEIFSEENLTVKRPGTGRSPMEWDKVIGSVALKNYLKDEQI